MLTTELYWLKICIISRGFWILPIPNSFNLYPILFCIANLQVYKYEHTPIAYVQNTDPNPEILIVASDIINQKSNVSLCSRVPDMLATVCNLTAMLQVWRKRFFTCNISFGSLFLFSLFFLLFSLFSIVDLD